MNIQRIPGPAVLVTLAALSISPQVLAQGNASKPKPNPKPAVTVSLDATPNPVVFGSVTTLTGSVIGPAQSGIVIRFEQDTTKPFGDHYTPSAQTATTNSGGKYTLSFKPSANTQLRAIAQTSPPVTSGPRLVLVRTLVGLRVSDSTPRRGGFVTFSGAVFPAHDGQRALVQRRTSSGGWLTVARPLLKDAGTAKSTYTRRIRISRDAVYRVKISGHDDHVNGFSRTRSLTIH